MRDESYYTDNYFDDFRYCPVCGYDVSHHDWYDCQQFMLWDLANENPATPCPSYEGLQEARHNKGKKAEQMITSS